MQTYPTLKLKLERKILVFFYCFVVLLYMHFRRSSTGEGHFFFTGVHMRRLFNSLKERIGKPPASQPIPIPTASQQPLSLPPPLPPRRERSKTIKTPLRSRHSPSDPINASPDSLRDCDTLLVHTPSLSSFTRSPRTTCYGLEHASPATSINSSLSRIEPLESELASSTTTMNLASLSHDLPTSLDHTPSFEQEKSIYQYMESTSDHSDDDQSDTSEDSIYIQMSAAKEMMGTDASMISSASHNDLELVGSWTKSKESTECPLQYNPSYLAFETITNS